MNVSLKPQVAALLRGRDDADELVNSILFAYLTDQFIRKADVAGVVHTKALYKSHFQCSEVFDAATRQFKGVVVEGAKKSESLFVPNKKLHALLRDNQVVLVMKTPRTKPVHVESPDMSFTPAARDEFA